LTIYKGGNVNEGVLYYSKHPPYEQIGFPPLEKGGSKKKLYFSGREEGVSGFRKGGAEEGKKKCSCRDRTSDKGVAKVSRRPPCIFL